MKVKSFWKKDMELGEAIEDHLSSGQEGQMEELADETEKLKSTISKVMEALVEKGVLNLDYVNAILNTDFKEVPEE